MSPESPVALLVALTESTSAYLLVRGARHPCWPLAGVPPLKFPFERSCLLHDGHLGDPELESRELGAVPGDIRREDLTLLWASSLARSARQLCWLLAVGPLEIPG